MAEVVPWVTAEQVVRPPDVSAATVDVMCQFASDVLFAFSGRAFRGVTAASMRPACGCPTRRECGCYGRSRLVLPAAPVVAVTEVLIDGTAVDPAEWRVDDDVALVRLPEADGTRRVWPSWQRLDRQPDEEDTFRVSWTHGVAPPAGGVMAAELLASELLASVSPSCRSSCRLPERVTTVTRQGVTTTVLDPLTLFADGLVGLPSVDLWLASVRMPDVAGYGGSAGVAVPGRPARVWHRETGGES